MSRELVPFLRVRLSQLPHQYWTWKQSALPGDGFLLRMMRGQTNIAAMQVMSTVAPMQVTRAVEASTKDLGLSTLQLVSRAYHHALFMAQIAPSGMIYIACRNGWSHRPDEYASPAAIENGVKVLALTLARLAGQGAATDKSEL